jgi:signal transduction histidine kinase
MLDKMSNSFFGKKLHTFLFFFLLANINALFNFSVLISTELVEGNTPKFLLHVIEELTGSYSFFSLVPLMLLLFKKLPIKRNNLITHIPLYFIAAFCIGFLHTLIMFITRTILYDAIGWGNYDFGYLPYRILMESLKLLLGFWILYGIYIMVKVSREKQNEKFRLIQLEEELTKTRLQILQSQLNPHFLFNTLNMISSTMYDDIHAADKMIANLSDLLRITLKRSNKGENILSSELEILNLYLEIMKARFGDKLKIIFDVDEKTNNALVPNFLFQPLVENSIKYGMENLTETKISLSTKKVDEKLLIKIKDNGPGIQKKSEQVLNGGVGISNTIERLGKLYNNNYKFEWENLADGGLLLTIEIPFKNGGAN